MFNSATTAIIDEDIAINKSVVPMPFLATTHRSRYLLEPTYLPKSTCLINTPTTVATVENDTEGGAQKRVLQLHWICLV